MDILQKSIKELERGKSAQSLNDTVKFVQADLEELKSLQVGHSEEGVVNSDLKSIRRHLEDIILKAEEVFEFEGEDCYHSEIQFTSCSIEALEELKNSIVEFLCAHKENSRVILDSELRNPNKSWETGMYDLLNYAKYESS